MVLGGKGTGGGTWKTIWVFPAFRKQQDQTYQVTIQLPAAITDCFTKCKGCNETAAITGQPLLNKKRDVDEMLSSHWESANKLSPASAHKGKRNLQQNLTATYPAP